MQVFAYISTCISLLRFLIYTLPALNAHSAGVPLIRNHSLSSEIHIRLIVLESGDLLLATCS